MGKYEIFRFTNFGQEVSASASVHKFLTLPTQVLIPVTLVTYLDWRATTSIKLFTDIRSRQSNRLSFCGRSTVTSFGWRSKRSCTKSTDLANSSILYPLKWHDARLWQPGQFGITIVKLRTGPGWQLSLDRECITQFLDVEWGKTHPGYLADMFLHLQLIVQDDA